MTTSVVLGDEHTEGYLTGEDVAALVRRCEVCRVAHM